MNKPTKKQNINNVSNILKIYKKQTFHGLFSPGRWNPLTCQVSSGPATLTQRWDRRRPLIGQHPQVRRRGSSDATLNRDSGRQDSWVTAREGEIQGGNGSGQRNTRWRCRCGGTWKGVESQRGSVSQWGAPGPERGGLLWAPQQRGSLEGNS